MREGKGRERGVLSVPEVDADAGSAKISTTDVTCCFRLAHSTADGQPTSNSVSVRLCKKKIATIINKSVNQLINPGILQSCLILQGSVVQGIVRKKDLVNR